MSNNTRKTKNENIYDKYRMILERLKLTDKEIEEMSHNLKLVALTICGHIWKKKFY